MIRQYLYVLLLLLLLSISSPIKALVGDSTQVSVLTCSPGTEIYALFGHTAIRFQNFTQKQDVVFNYGMFNFNTPNFIIRFVKGETDYQLGIIDYTYFESEYALRNSSVYEQILNLLPEEKERLWNILLTNYDPVNRTYRYNFFYDNCTTRARDKIEECINGTVDYVENNSVQTFRNIVHQCTVGHPWSEFGMDICLGAPADQPIDYRQKMFAPYYYMNALSASAVTKEGDGVCSFAGDPKEIVVRSTDEETDSHSTILTPFMTTSTLLLLTLLLTYYGIKRKKSLWGLDLLLFGMVGLVGCVITFLVFCSVHPTVNTNYLLVLFNPIPLLYLPVMIYRLIKRKRDAYDFVNLIVLTLFILLLWLIPQDIPLAVLPLALCLLVRSTSHLVLTHKRSK